MQRLNLGAILAVDCLGCATSDQMTTYPTSSGSGQTAGTASSEPSERSSGERSSERPPATRTLELKLDESVELAPGTSVTWTEVADSRCPTGVTCVWAGEVAVALSIPAYIYYPISGGRPLVIRIAIQFIFLIPFIKYFFKPPL